MTGWWLVGWFFMSIQSIGRWCTLHCLRMSSATNLGASRCGGRRPLGSRNRRRWQGCFVCFRGARVFSFREIQNIIYTESIYIYMNCWFSIARFRLLEAFFWPQKWHGTRKLGGRLVSKICRTWSCSIWMCVEICGNSPMNIHESHLYNLYIS